MRVGEPLNVKTIGGIKRRVFASFNTERDRSLRDFFMNEGRKQDATWSVIRWSEPYADDDVDDGRWVTETTGRIRQTDLVVVLLGQTTFTCKNVLKELTIAEVLGMNVVQVVVPAAGAPHIIPNVGRVVHWEWDTVKRAMLVPPKGWASAHKALA